VVFYQKRSFIPADFRKFMFEQSKPLPEMINFVCRLKERQPLKVAVASNEGRELMLHRIREFNLDELWISSSLPVSYIFASRTPTYTTWRWTSHKYRPTK
jgi:putative hydrolase of the HAD superfamily